ncbi:MAG: LytR/AlgR family response regulator transcription factor [Deferribacterales bacterium]
MLRIAICDDLPEDLRRLVSLTDEFVSANGFDAVVTGFSHPDALLTAIESGSFHIYILDIVMPMVSGLELGMEIRRSDSEAQIIFATTEPQFALQAYAANPINYLVKPIDRQKLFDAMSLAVSRADIAEEQIFSVKTAGSLRVLRLRDIVCCEYRSHSVCFTLKSGEEILSRTFRESFSQYCAPLLKNRHFLQCHNAFVVNMHRIEHFSKESFTFFGGMVVPIAAKRYPAVRDAYMDYISAKRG